MSCSRHTCREVTPSVEAAGEGLSEGDGEADGLEPVHIQSM